ncbi:hypothetical protein W03_20700 [Nitrosomonas sp. PY1]|uniref:DUF4437 domain-containing protein n=1 Tax=Nitrosomonas sp. PY1 TaxID=1803906 RepID=UPI001FC83FC3|nr:DUF4437 domain-containing protein [Nitrosomonas sp. PY1]GKS70066.1 hypothetical protein W03_20700 [Nitrosomonas sp. PY1]
MKKIIRDFYNTSTSLISWVFLVAFLSVSLFSAQSALAANGDASNKNPLSFGAGQLLIDFSRLTWKSMKSDQVPEGAEIAILRGDFKTEPTEAVVRLPANYTFPAHSHPITETYVWIQGDFSYVNADGNTVDMKAPTFISLPENVPHALICKDQPCMFYVRYEKPFEVKFHPMPKVEKIPLPEIRNH